MPDLDLTAELITHRFTPGSKEVLLGWYPRTRLEMDEEVAHRKHGKFGAVKYVYPRELMTELRTGSRPKSPPASRPAGSSTGPDLARGAGQPTEERATGGSKYVSGYGSSVGV